MAGQGSKKENSVENENNGIIEEVTSLFDAILGFEQCEASDAEEEWLNCDAINQGFHTDCN